MDKIPVMVQLEGKEYSGYFSQVMGGGSTSTFHLMVEGYYWGRLSFSEFANAWRFDPTPKTLDLEKLADEFGDLIIAWYQ